MTDISTALQRLDRLRLDGILADAEHEVARDAMLGITETAHQGRAIRAEAFRVLCPGAGGPAILMDVMTKARLMRYDWARLALHLDANELKRRLLGLPYEFSSERWDDLLTKLERLRDAREREHLSSEQTETVKYALLGRLDWLGLVGELIWLRQNWDELILWRREDGWSVTDEDVDATLAWLVRRTPHEESPVSDQRIHHYYDWIEDQCWRYYNHLIAEGDVRFLRSHGVRRLDVGQWSF